MSFASSVKIVYLRFKRMVSRHYPLARRLLIATFVIGGILLVSQILVPGARLVKEAFFGPVNVFTVTFNQGANLKNDNGRTNILLLGVGGVGHDGPNLTDAIMVLSVKTKLDQQRAITLPGVLLLSIPRDIYIESLQNKINTAYQTGLDQGVGTTLARSIVSQIIGLPIHYAVVLDFSAFDELIDTFGGIDVNVESTLNDPGYPIEGRENETCGFSPTEIEQKTAMVLASPATEIEAFPCRYEQLHFDLGQQHMDGKTALKFVRSRHAQGDEGTDFARNRRQQLVLKAIKEAILSSQTLTNPSKLLNIYAQVKSHINSDLDPNEVSALLNLAFKYKNAPLKSASIDLNLLENPPIDWRGWILLPKDGNWEKIHQFVASQLENQK